MILLIHLIKEISTLQTIVLDQIILEANKLYFKDVFNTLYPLPHLTSLWHLYHHTEHPTVKAHIASIFKEDLGTLLVVEIMIDPTHEVTLKRLETGEIKKNMKHVHDYYIIPKSHYALAKKQFEEVHTDSAVDTSFEDCHFSMFSYGLAILREKFPTYYNPYTKVML